MGRARNAARKKGHNGIKSGKNLRRNGNLNKTKAAAANGAEILNLIKTPASQPSSTAPISAAAPGGSGEGGGSGDSTPATSAPVAVNQGTEAASTTKPPVQRIEENETTVDENNDATNVDELSENELEVKEATELLTPEQQRALEEAKKKTNGTGSKDGKIEKTGEPNDEKPEEDKFDIQQGDFIEFLMKDVVLAGAAWLGKKTSGYVGLYTYKALSWAYHGTKDELLSPAWNTTTDFLEEKYKAAKANAKEALRTPEEYEIKDTLKREDATTGYARKVIAEHNQVIKDVKEVFNPEVYNRFAEAVVNGTLKEKTQNGKLVWQDEETLACIQVDSPFMNDLIKGTQKYLKTKENLPEEEFKNLQKNTINALAKITSQNSWPDAAKKTFVSNMVTAQLLRQRAETPDKEPTAENIKLLEAKMSAVYISEWIKIQKDDGKSEFKDVKELLKASDKAMKASYKDIADGNYAENGKNPSPNETLDHLTNLNAQEIDQKGSKTLHEEAVSYLDSMGKMEALLAEANNAVSGFGARLDEQKNQKQSKTKEDKTKDGNKNKKPFFRFGKKGRNS